MFAYIIVNMIYTYVSIYVVDSFRFISLQNVKILGWIWYEF